MGSYVSWVLLSIGSAVEWLASWEYQGVTFLSFLIGVAVIGIVLRFVF